MALTKAKEFRLDLSEKFPHLARAPIVEAVVQWVARADKPFPSEEMGEELRTRLPEYPTRQRQHEIQVEATFDTADGTSTHSGGTTWHGFRFTSADKRYVAQFTRNGLIFSRLAPYEDWNTFSQEALRLWTIFREVAKPSEVERLGVRFVNRMPLTEPEQARRHLAAAPKCLEPLGLPVSSFLYQSLHDVPVYPFQINVVRTIQPPAPPKSDQYGLILDIDVFTTQPFPPADGIVLDYLPKMRWLKNKAFFSLLSKRTIKHLEKEES